MKRLFSYYFPKRINLKKIKEWFFTDYKKEYPKLEKEIDAQATVSLYILLFLMTIVTLFIFLMSLFSNINLFLLAKSLSVFAILFPGILILRKYLKNEKKDYYLLLFTVIIIASWSVAKDIANFGIVFNRYGILYIVLLFFGMIFMPFPPYVPLLLGVYCVTLYGILWLLFIKLIFGYEWMIYTGSLLKIKWLNDHIDLIRTNKLFFNHWRFNSAWYFFQYMIYGIAATIFRAANIQTYIKAYLTNQKLLAVEANLNAIQNLLSNKEDQYIEFKSSARWDYNTKTANKDLEMVIVKTIAGFINSAGGTLLIGVDDNGEPLGLENDYQTLKKNNKDGYELYLINLISKYLGKEYYSVINISFYTIKNKEICILNIQPDDKPIFVELMGQAFFIRKGNSTQKLNTKEALDYIQKHFN